MNEIPAVYRLVFAIGFIFLAWYYGRREIAPESGPCETASENPPSAIQENSEPHPEQPPTTIPGPVEATTASRSETKSPSQETPPEPRPVPAPQPPIRVVQVLADDRMVIECHPNGSFLARGSIRRMTDGRWVQDGIWSNYWPKGTVSSVGEWKDGAQIGPWLFASEDGRSTVTNHPPFANTVAVAQQSVPSGTTTAQDSVAVAKVDNEQETMPVNTGSDQAAEEPPVTASSTVAAPSAKRTNPDLFVCGKHDSDPYLKDADALFLRGEWNRAKNAFSAYGDQHLNAPERAYAMLQKAVCEERMGKLPEARAAYQDFLRVFGREECGAKGQAGLAALLWKQPSSRTLAIAEYEKLVKNYPTAPEAATALKVLGDYYLGQRDYAKARDCYEKLLANFPEAPGRPEVEAQAEAARLAGDCKTKAGLTAGLGFHEAVTPAQDLMARGRYKEAIILYQELFARFSASPESASYCLMQMAACRFALHEYDKALRLFETLIARYPTSAEAPEACWRCVHLIYCFMNNRPQDIQRFAQKVLKDYPETFAAQKIHFVVGSMNERKNHGQNAAAYWREFLQRWPQTPYRAAIDKRLAQLAPPPGQRISLGGSL